RFKFLYLFLFNSSLFIINCFGLKNIFCTFKEFFLPVVDVIRVNLVFFSKMTDLNIVFKKFSKNKNFLLWRIKFSFSLCFRHKNFLSVVTLNKFKKFLFLLKHYTIVMYFISTCVNKFF